MNPNEQWVAERFLMHIASATPIVAAEQAMMDFAACFPSSTLGQYVNDPNEDDPITVELFLTLVGFNPDTWAASDWGNLPEDYLHDPIEANMHFTSAMLELIYTEYVWERP